MATPQYNGPGAATGVSEASRNLMAANAAFAESLKGIGNIADRGSNMIQGKMDDSDTRLASDFNQLMKSFSDSQELQQAIDDGVFSDLSEGFYSADIMKQQMDSLDTRFDKLVADEWQAEERAEQRLAWGENKLVREENARERIRKQTMFEQDELRFGWEKADHNRKERDMVLNRKLHAEAMELVNGKAVLNHMASEEVFNPIFESVLGEDSLIGDEVNRFVLPNGSLDTKALSEAYDKKDGDGNVLNSDVSDAISLAWADEMQRAGQVYNPTAIKNFMNARITQFEDPLAAQAFMSQIESAVDGAFDIDPRVSAAMQQAKDGLIANNPDYKDNPYVKFDVALGGKGYLQALNDLVGVANPDSFFELVSPAMNSETNTYWWRTNTKSDTAGMRNLSKVVSDVITNGGYLDYMGERIPITPETLYVVGIMNNQEKDSEKDIRDSLIRAATGTATPEKNNMVNAHTNYTNWSLENAGIERSFLPSHQVDHAEILRKEVAARAAVKKQEALHRANETDSSFLSPFIQNTIKAFSDGF